MTLQDFMKMVAGYEEIADQVRAVGKQVLDKKFPPCADPNQQQQEFLNFVDRMALSSDNQADAFYYRQLSLCVHGLLWLRNENKIDFKKLGS